MQIPIKAKYLANADFDKYKTRIVIRGNLQHHYQNIDISSFCVRVQSILMLLDIVNLDKLTVRAVDIKTAYLHANVYGKMNKKLVPYLLRLYSHMSNLVNRCVCLNLPSLSKSKLTFFSTIMVLPMIFPFASLPPMTKFMLTSTHLMLSIQTVFLTMV